ncbi:MAG: thioredoxin family protein [Planctomycetota bacterium]|nr:thioredoxin family protein [Planctomycetota bacterium]
MRSVLSPSRSFAFALLLAAAFAAHAGAAELPAIEWSLKTPAVEAVPGKTVNVEVLAKLPAGYHTYSMRVFENGPLPTSLKVEPADLVTVVEKIALAPAPVMKFDKGFNLEIEILEKDTTFTLPVTVSATAKPGTYDVTVTTMSQLCDEKECLLPKRAKLALKLTVVEAPAKTSAEAKTPPETKTEPAKTPDEKPEQPAKTDKAENPEKTGETKSASPMTLSRDEQAIADARAKGLWSYFWAAVAAGAGALLTPCVFPMIPITVSFFTKRKEATRAAKVRDAFVYALGIVLTFSIIGMVFAGFFKATALRDFSANGWVNLVIALIFGTLAMNLFGVFEIPLPTEFLSKVDSSARGGGGGVVPILLMAFVFSITSFTCTVPFIGLVLVSASHGEWFMPLVGMLGFSMAFSAPFFLLALFPSVLKSLPKAGGWMNSVKVVMGFLELAAALKFLSTADIYWNTGAHFLPRELFLGIWIALCVLTTLYLLGLFQFSHDSKVEFVGGVRILASTFFLACAFWLFSGYFGNTFGLLEAFIPQRPEAALAQPSGEPGTAPAEMTWLSDFDAGVAEGKRTGKPVFVDFTGYTCSNCRVMEATIFPLPSIQQRLASFVRVKLYTDDQKNPDATDRNVKLQEERFGSATLPYYVILSPTGEHVASHSFDADADSFASFLDLGLKTTVSK